MTSGKENWSQDVTGKSDALNLENGVFTKEDPAEIAASLKRSAKSGKRKSSPYASAMSMLTFHINRAGSNLSKKDRDRLEEAKDELRKQFGREPKSD